MTKKIPQKNERCFGIYLRNVNEDTNQTLLRDLIKAYAIQNRKVAENYKESDDDREGVDFKFFHPSFEFVGELLVNYNIVLKPCYWE